MQRILQKLSGLFLFFRFSGEGDRRRRGGRMEDTIGITMGKIFHALCLSWTKDNGQKVHA